MNKAMRRAMRQARAIKTRKNKKRAVRTWCAAVIEGLRA